MRARRRAVLASLLAAGMLQSCGGPVPNGHGDNDARFVAAQVTDADRLAAASLSLSSAATVQGGDPYATSVACAAAIGVLQDVIRDNSLVGDRERQGIQSAGVEYVSRTVRLGAQGNRSQAQANAEIRQAQEALADNPGGAARSALACISELARGN